MQQKEQLASYIIRQSIIKLRRYGLNIISLRTKLLSKLIKPMHESYQNNLFDSQTDSDHKKFWRCIKTLRKDQTGVMSLTVDDKVLHNPIRKRLKY